MVVRHTWSPQGSPAPLPPDLVGFLVDRLTEELALIWERQAGREDPHLPGVAAQLEAVDDVLSDLRAGRRPDPVTLALLRFAYAGHPEADAGRPLP